MLIEILSDAFKVGDKVRDALSFHEGLNSVIAFSKENNSIGKTSFLLVLDFVFGGDTYCSEEAGIIRNIGHHEIKFAFRFDRKIHRFTRSTDNEKKVSVCGDSYDEKKSIISVDEYKSELLKLYDLKNLKMNFRDVVSTYSRISHKSPKELTVFLKQHQNEYDGDAVIRLERLFEKYDLIQEEIEKYNHAKNISEAFNKAQKLNFISGSNLKKKEIENIQKEISELEEKNEIICNNSSSEQLASLDKEHAVKAAKIQGNLQPLRSKRTKLLNKIESTQKTLDGLMIPTKEEMEVLKTFFPNANLKKLYDIEEFHFKMSEILCKELKYSLLQLQQELKNVESQIFSAETELQSITPGKALPKAAYSEYANNFSKILKLREKLENFEKGKDLKLSSDKLRQDLFIKEIDILNQISNTINSTMGNYNSQIQGGKWKNPTIHFEMPKTTMAKGISNYRLSSENDRGDGTQGADVILFDLSVLNLTKLPFIIHDGFVRNEVDLEREQDFIKLYSLQKNKQIFTEFNGLEKYSKETQTIILKSKVIELGNGDNSLYGKSFAVK